MKFHDLPKSSNIEGIHFDAATGCLSVKFRNGGVYHYDGCKQSHFDEMCGAESAGRYLNSVVKKGFKFRKQDAKKPKKEAA